MSRIDILKALIDERCGGNQADFARLIKRSPSQVNQWLSGHRAIGDAGAANIEKKLGLSAGHFDGAKEQMTYPKSVAIIPRPANEPSPTHPSPIDELVSVALSMSVEGRYLLLGRAQELAPRYPAAKANHSN